MQIDRTDDLNVTNFKLFLSTVKELSNSQGFYSRLQNQINEWTEEQFNQARDYFNGLNQKFKDGVDVVLFLEQ